jgi:hypothetical protein
MIVAGLRMPDFIIGGAPRCGTTWLYEVLSCHQAVYMAKPARPEPKFCLVDEIYKEGLARYGEWFADAADDQIAGEKSTNYLESATAAERIKRHLPGIKLIFMLRDPVSRAYSNYLWSRMNGLEHEDFQTALSLEKQREQDIPQAMRYARPYAYFARGLYADMLKHYFALFSRWQILCLRYEDIEEKPKELLSAVWQFLGIEPHYKIVTGVGVVNASKQTTEGLAPDVKQMLQAAYEEPNRQLADLLGAEFKVWLYR